MSDNFDVIIIGNGCIGLGLARQLQQEAPGLKVAVVGPADRAGAATMAAGAMLALWAEVEKDHFSDPTLSDRFTLPERGTALWQDYAAGLSEESGIDLPIKWGSYVICNARGSDLDDENFDYMVEQLRLRQQDVEFVSYRELGFLAPANHARPSRVARIPDGHIDARKVVEALETSLGKSADCSLIDARASTLDAGLTNSGKVNGRGKTVTLDNGESLSAPTVVLANGAYAVTRL